MNLGKVKEIGVGWIKALIWGKSDVRTAEQSLPYGIDSKPVLGKMAVYSKTENNGKAVILGYVDITTITKTGELRLYATDSNGLEVSRVHFKDDGTCEFMGDDDYFVRFSALKSEFDNLLRIVNENASAHNTHTHPIPTGNTLVTLTQAGVSTADIDKSKITRIKTYKTEIVP